MKQISFTPSNIQLFLLIFFNQSHSRRSENRAGNQNLILSCVLAIINSWKSACFRPLLRCISNKLFWTVSIITLIIKMNCLEFNKSVVLFLLLYFIFCSISIKASTTSPIDIEGKLCPINIVDNILLNWFIKITDQLKEMRLEINQLNRKSGLSDLKNIRQDREIRFLKTLLSSIVFQQSHSAMQKRAARLIPVQLLM